MGNGQHIKMEYDETTKFASDLAQIANDSDTNIVTEINNLISTLEPGWRGSSGDLMTEVLTMCLNKQKKIAMNMNAVSEQINMVAKSLKAADDDAAQRNQNA